MDKPVTLTPLKTLPIPNLGPGVVLSIDEQEGMWLHVDVPKANPKKPHGIFAPSIYQIWPTHLARPHLSTQFGRVQKILSGKSSNPFQVWLYVCPVRQYRKHARIKDAVGKILLSLYENLCAD